MKRKEFILKSIGAGVLMGSAATLGKYSNVFAAADNDLPYDLVAVRGGSAPAMFDRGIAALGGMGKFVKEGQTVVVKPNIGWDRTPEMGANTNPELVGRIIEHCFEAGASRVSVFDHTCDEWRASYRNSGIEKAATDAGARVVPGNSERYYHDITIPQGRRLKAAKEHELLLQSDVFINVPVLKHHGGASITVAMKNLMGNIWDRRYYHQNDLHQCITDYATYRKPDLNIVDAYRVMMRNGPRGISEEDVVLMEAQVISSDMVAADAASSLMFGMQPNEVGHIRLGEEMGVGTMNLESLNISRLRM
ncbi:DUF362 domain-containing protein [Balneolaceae bacterium ANBcel3]|nr:DUF362 domain-containing protein [Balneolaceae bacterium ANBcel3]